MPYLRWIVAASNLFTALLVAGLAIPLIRGRVAPNRWYGARTQRAFASEEAWYRINEHSGRRLLFWSVVVFACGIAALMPGVHTRILTALAFAPLVYAFAAYETHRFSKTL